MPAVDLPAWEWPVAALGLAALAYGLLLVGLVARGRAASAGALARLLPDVAVLFRRLLADPRVPRHRKLAALGGVAYLAAPIDLVPDFIPVAGQADDVAVIALVLRYLARAGGPELLEDLWPGPPATLRAVLRAAGYQTRPTAGTHASSSAAARPSPASSARRRRWRA